MISQMINQYYFVLMAQQMRFGKMQTIRICRKEYGGAEEERATGKVLRGPDPVVGHSDDPFSYRSSSEIALVWSDLSKMVSSLSALP